MISSGLTSSVIHQASLGDGYVPVRDGGLVTAVAEFLYDEAALLDECLDEWLALFHPEAAKYLIPSPEDLSDDPATTLHLVNDSMTTLAGRIARLKNPETATPVVQATVSETPPAAGMSARADMPASARRPSTERRPAFDARRAGRRGTGLALHNGWKPPCTATDGHGSTWRKLHEHEGTGESSRRGACQTAQQRE